MFAKTYTMTAYHNDKVVFVSTVLDTVGFAPGTDLGDGWRLVRNRPESTQDHVHVDVEKIPKQPIKGPSE